MRRIRRFTLVFAALALAAFAALLLYGHARRHPEDVPWTALDLSRPVGAFTGRKLAGLGDESGRCLALLERSGVRYRALPPRRAGPGCGYRDAVGFAPGGSLAVAYRPAGLGMRCAVAASLAAWEWHVVQPAARRHFGSEVREIEHFGSYSCRRLYGRDEGAWSEHASANAVDIAGFRLASGVRIAIAADWGGGGAKAAFLRDVHEGACALFATALGPGYNAAHRDHFHFDQAARGAWGWRACR